MPWYIILKDVFLPRTYGQERYDWTTKALTMEEPRKCAYDIYVKEKQQHYDTVEKYEKMVNSLEKQVEMHTKINDKLLTHQRMIENMSLFQLIKWYIRRAK